MFDLGPDESTMIAFLGHHHGPAETAGNQYRSDGRPLGLADVAEGTMAGGVAEMFVLLFLAEFGVSVKCVY
jgi:hypothetical protein